MCLGIERGATGWKGQMNPQSLAARLPRTCLWIGKKGYAPFPLNMTFVNVKLFVTKEVWLLFCFQEIAAEASSAYLLKTFFRMERTPFSCKRPVWPDLAIYWTLGNFLKPLAAISLPKSPTVLGNFCKGVKICHFSSEIIFGHFYRHLAIFF